MSHSTILRRAAFTIHVHQDVDVFVATGKNGGLSVGSICVGDLVYTPTS